jgi:uncharacterized protein (DUF362 family)
VRESTSIDTVSRPHVWLGSVSTYDTHAVGVGVERGLEHVRVTVHGNAVGLVDWTDASGAAPSVAATRPELVEGALDVLLGREEDLFMVLTGRAGVGLCGRRVARLARGAARPFSARGFLEIPKLHPGRVTIRPADEARRYRYQLSVGRRLGIEQRDAASSLPADVRWDDRVPAGWELYHADSVVAFPKLAGAPRMGGMTGAVALAGGMARPHDAAPSSAHARRLADAAEVAWPDLVITDAVEIGWGGARRTQPGRPLNLVILADDPLAHDVVVAHLLGLDPETMPHLRMLSERGYGSLSLDDIAVDGDVTLEEVQDRLLGFGPRPPAAADACRWFEDRTGMRPGIVVRCTAPEGDACETLVAERLAAAWDSPDARERLKFWPPTVIRVGPGAVPLDPGVHHLVGGAAIEAFRRDHPKTRTLLRLPDRLARRWDGPSELLRWRRQDGESGFALAIDGDPPSARALQRSLYLGSLGRIRSPWGGFWSRVLHLLEGFGAMLRRAIRNRDGVPVVHARKIPRLRGRAWRRRWAAPPALELRPDLLDSNTVAGLPEPEPEH